MMRSITGRRSAVLLLLLVGLGGVAAAEATLETFSYEDPVFVGNDTRIQFELVNDGSSTANSSYNLTISRNGSIVETFIGAEEALAPGENRTFNDTFETTETGNHTIDLEATVGNDTITRSVVFYVGTYNFSIARFDFRQLTVLGNKTNVTVTLANTGIRPVSSKFKVEVYNVNSTKLYTYYQPEETIQPGENRTEYITHVAHRNGTFFLRLRATLNDEVLLDAATLRVVDEFDPDLPPVKIIRRKVVFQQPEPREEEEFLRRQWRIKPPPSVTLSQNSSLSFPLTIRSTGEGPLENVMLKASATGNLSLDYEPSIIFDIPPNESRSFAVELTSGMDQQREGLINYEVTSRRLSAQGTIKVKIRPDVTVRQLEHRLTDMEFLLDRAAAEITAAQRAGINVSTAVDDLEEGREHLEEAKAALNRNDTQATKASLAEAQTALSESFSNLYEAQSRRAERNTTPVRPLFLLGLTSLICGSLVVGWYYRLKHRFERRPKLLREAE